MAPDDGIYNHIVKVCHWASEDILGEVEWIRQEGQTIVELMFHFMDGEVAKNIAHYN
ncbi:hypothetical protein PILCRDRAFT_6736 [Piloderma croceum F 1598]|uniref:Uncharacterized protein n=1 Tax=Piloderma croceum (strain F 1598) TaxID=765440 RepID=A0A0C3FWA4_PILCF|nr:hypothetical protein PILCRDRAFT_6736 [Piloderma croceum F 1598]